MTLQALLVSKDDDAAEALSRVLAGFGVAVERSSDPEIATERLNEHKFDEVIVDFDEPQATLLLQTVPQPASGNRAVMVALISNGASVRSVFEAGANFLLRKPISVPTATASLRAATALLNRERRRAFRVPAQASVVLSAVGGQEIEGIVLDLSETGMEVLAAQPLLPSALISFRFTLPDGSAEIGAQGEVAWVNPNGQAGVHFLDVPENQQATLSEWLKANCPEVSPDDSESVSHCKLTDLSVGGCYVETESPFPERALIDLCLKAADMDFHIDGLVRVMHPESGMGIEFPSRTSEQREKVGGFIQFLTSCPGIIPELSISPRSLIADEAQFKSDENSQTEEDPLLELLHTGQALASEDFLAELRKQRSSAAAASS
jgi:CheY-like chemotaxis protein